MGKRLSAKEAVGIEPLSKCKQGDKKLRLTIDQVAKSPGSKCCCLLLLPNVVTGWPEIKAVNDSSARWPKVESDC